MAGTNYTSKTGSRTSSLSLYDTYDDVAIHEELSDIIYDISPTDTPFMSAVGKGSVGNTVFDWQTDQLAAAAANTKAEGASVAAASQSTTNRITNYTQISTKTVKSSGTVEAVGTAGRKSELAYQLAKAGKEIKRDMEYMFLSDQIASAGSAGSPTRTTRGVLHSIALGLESEHIINCDSDAAAYTGKSGVDNIEGATTTTWNIDQNAAKDYTMSTGATTAVSFSEADILTLQQAIWEDGGEPSMMIMSAAAKKTFSTFSGRVDQVQTTDSSTTVHNVVDVYVSDFGTLTAQADRFTESAAVFLLEPSTWSVEYLRPFQTKDLPLTEDGQSKYILAEYGLKCTTPEANGAMINTA